MDRLVDYFAVVGYDFEYSKAHALRGKVVTRIPEYEWDDMPFTQGIELFCQPAGWYLAQERQAPTFFVSVLTDAEGMRHYCAVLAFTEPISPKEQDSNQNSNLPRRKSLSPVSGGQWITGRGIITKLTPKRQNQPFAPKCLVILSRINDFRVLKNCLGLIYTVYIEGLTISMETIIAKLLIVKVPPPGSAMLRFSIGAADKQAIQTPQSDHLPVTRASVAMLLRQLGILNVLNILCAALVDQKLLFYSCSYSRLSEACNALTALMYPFVYSYPYVPILPQHILEYTSSPTPFLIGIHSSLKNELHELLDVITVDLDGGVISIPECVNIPMIPEPYYTNVVEALTKVLCPDLVVADYAYPPEQVKSSEPERLDKEIRAIFLRLFSQLLMGYRSCLQVCRVHPKPIIRFLKNFLLMRGFSVHNTPSANEFVPKLLDSQAFSLFVQSNGPPYRKLHKFDEIVSEMPNRIETDMSNVLHAMRHIKMLASDLYINENPNHLSITEKIPKPSSGSHGRPNQPRFPKLSATAVQTFMEETRVKGDSARPPKRITQSARRVPEGSRPASFTHRSGTTSSRRLEVLKNCMTFIFDSKALEIKKIFQAVLRALKSRSARSALTLELTSYSKSHPQLDNQQFDYIARLINSALQDSSGQLDENTLAADLLPVVTAFYRVSHLYSYTLCLSQTSLSFPFLEYRHSLQIEIYKTWCNMISPHSSPDELNPPCIHYFIILTNPSESSPLLFSPTQLKRWESKPPESRQEESSSEEGVVFSQAMHNAQRMVFMLVPLDSTRSIRAKFLRLSHGEENSSNSCFTNSVGGSTTGSCDEESGFEESENSPGVASTVSKFVTKFVDRVCTEANISNEHTKMLSNKIPTLVHMQVESLQDVCKESKRLPPIKKAKLLQPNLLMGETQVITKPMRAYLASDGRATAVGGEVGGPALLPAEGAMFVTSYRVIFIGVPCDALASEQVVIRSFPVSSLFKVKSFSVNDFPHVGNIDPSLQHGVQLRSATFQFLLLAFDDEVSPEQQQQLQNELQKLRYPLTIDGAFAMSAARAPRMFNSNKVNFRKKTNSTSSTSSTMSSSRYKGGGGGGEGKWGGEGGLQGIEQVKVQLYSGIYFKLQNLLPPIDEAMTKTLSDKDTMHRLFQRSCESDYKRMGLLNTEGNRYRLSRVNRMFSVCRSYPACLVVPMSVSDEQVKSLAHCHHQSRFPCIVWMHPTSSAVLMRCSGIRTRTASSLFKHGQSTPMLSDEGTTGSGHEEERFLMKIASFSSPTSRPSSQLFREDSMSTIQTIRLYGTHAVHAAHNAHNAHDARDACDVHGAHDAHGANDALVGHDTHDAHNVSHSALQSVRLPFACERGALQDFQNSGLCVLFVPLDISEPKQIRTSFKSMIKACLPAEPPTPSNPTIQQQQLDAGFLHGVEESGWLAQVSLLLEISGAVVDIMDIHGGSVMLSVEDGCDTVPQISSLAQIMLDPHYRTIRGFQTLVQKEWLSFGHRFSHRNRFNDVQSSGFTPVFLQFLDAVFQLVTQFPLSFEFNSTYLELIAYHSVSNRFTTFLLDSDYERLEAGILFGKKAQSSKSPGHSSLSSAESASPAGDSPTFCNSSPSHMQPMKSLWDYVDAIHERSHLLLNTFFAPEQPSSQILRPVHSLCRLKLWPYYVREALGEGPPFDGLLGELTSGTSHNEQEATEVSVTGRRVVNGCYDNIADAQPDAIKMLLSQIDRLQTELGVPVDPWESTWKAFLNPLTLQRKVPEQTMQARSEVREMHKLTTVNVIHKRAAIREVSVQSENWANPPRHYGSPGQRYHGHGLHVQPVPNQHQTRGYHSIYTEIIKHPALSDPTVLPILSTPCTRCSQRTTSQYRMHPAQYSVQDKHVRTYEGILWKQGAYMKGWKPRFFVLDTTKHELRQYEAQGDNVCKSIIDLKELESVELVDPLSGAPKGTSSKSFFEVKLSKRQYHFIAENEQAAIDWVDNLQSAL
uniref:Myotubularin-related protein 13 n=1 Tax=Ciona savignyi TaxID=51511 RepID=H2Y620_CIOSA